jgi:hypothetical protein
VLGSERTHHSIAPDSSGSVNMRDPSLALRMSVSWRRSLQNFFRARNQLRIEIEDFFDILLELGAV